jgi:hypothetical protein
MTWNVGSTSGATWKVGTTTPVSTFGITQASAYTPGQPCTLQVIGAVGPQFWIVWSPTNDPSHARAVLPPITNINVDGNGNGTVTITALRGAVKYGTSGYMFLWQGEFSSHLLVPLLMEPGRSYVNLTSVHTPASERFEAVADPPDLSAGYQLSFFDFVNGTPADLNAYTDGGFDVDEDVASFKFEVHDNDGWGDAGIQNFTGARVGTLDGTLAVITGAFFGSTGEAQAPQQLGLLNGTLSAITGAFTGTHTAGFTPEGLTYIGVSG